MIKKFIAAKKSKAQALVEFALILTLLLTLLYGILEAGRLMFVYASTVTAARQATRYGSATGNNTAGIPYYKDCAGIRAAAKRVGFLAPFTDANIVITYDTGPTTSGGVALNWTCPAGGTFSGTDQGGIAVSGTRIKVCVSTRWNPIVGALVPLRWSGVPDCNGVVSNNLITKSSERTLLSSVAIGVTAIPGAWTGSGDLSLTVSASPDPYSTVGQLITYTYTLRNTGSVDLWGPFSLTANNTSATCGTAQTKLTPGETLYCTQKGYYTITQDDLDDGVVVSLTIATGGGASSGQVSNTITAVQYKQLTLTKSASPTRASVAGTIITYTYTLTNTGNVTLTSPYTVTDDKTSVTCPSVDALAKGASTTCTVNYTLKQNPDINDGILINTATATAKFGSTTITSNTDSATVYTSKLILTVTTSVSPLTAGQVPPSATIAGQVIAYSYTIYNNSGAAATSPIITITNSNFGNFTVSCPAGSIPDQTSITCAPVATTPATYTVTQANMDAGTALNHTATASANSGGAITSRPVITSIPIIQSPALSLAISNITTNPASAGIPTVTAVGNSVTFTYTLTNSGNVTLSPSYAVDSLVRNDTVSVHQSCPLATGLVPGASTTCTESMSIIAADLNGTYGPYVVKHASATAKFGIATILSDQQTGIVATYNGARLALSITPDRTSAPSTGTPITFTYTLGNTGNIPLTLPTPYSITWKIQIGSETAVDQPSFVCASPASTIPVNSSTTCTGTSSYTTTATAGNITNYATAPYAGTNALADATAQVTVTRGFLCNVTHSGPVPNTTKPAGVDQTTWTIYNNSQDNTVIHIDSITIFWASLNRSIKTVNLSGELVWNGATTSSGFSILKGVPSLPLSTLEWPLAVGIGANPLVLIFSGDADGIQVKLAFSEANCNAGLDSGNASQQQPCTIFPGSVTNFNGSETNGSVSLTWTAATNATSYQLYKSTDNINFSLLGSPVASSPANNVDTIPGSATQSTTQYYRIIPINSCGNGTASNVSVTRPACTLPGAFALTSPITRTGANVTLNWGASSGVTSYQVYRSVNGGAFAALGGSIAAGTTTKNDTINTGDTHAYYVVATNACGNTTSGTVSTTYPGTTTLSGSQTGGSVSLNWTESTGATGYKIYNSTDNVTFNLLTTVGAVTSAPNVDTIAAGATKYYRIIPTSSTGDGPTSNTVTIVGPCTPGATTLSGSQTNGNVSLTWTVSSNATGYRIYKSTDNFVSNNTLLTTVGAVTSAPNVDTIANGVTQYYRIIPTNACGDGATSAILTVIRPGATTLSGSQTAGSVSLTWTASTGATNYKIYNSTDNVTFNLLTTVGAVTSAPNVDTIAAGATKYYRIIPTSATGDGPTSNTVTIVGPSCTLPGSPTLSVLSFTRSGANISFTWTASSNATGYKIYKSTDNFVSNNTLLTTVGNVLLLNNADTIAKGVTQYYRIVPTNACGDGTTPSNIVTVTRPSDRIVSGIITEGVGNITPATVTMTVGGTACTRTTTTYTSDTFTCTMTEGTGTLVVGAYSTNWNNASQKTSRDNMVCLPNPVTTYGTPWGTTAGTTGLTDTTTFTFSNLSANVTFNILIRQQSLGALAGYTCYPGTIP